MLFAGSLLLRAPQGLGGLAETIPAYFKTWVSSSGIPLFRLPLSLLVYQPLVLILGLVGAIHAWLGSSDEQHSRQVMLGLSLLALVAFLLPWLYAGRQVADLAWAVVPLWALAALEISRSLTFDEDRVSNFMGVGLALLLSLFAVIGWLNFLSMGRFQVNLVVYWGIILGALLLGLIAVLLVIAGWSTRTGKLGAVLALCVMLGLYMASTTWGMAIVRQNGAQELWSLIPATGQADLLRQTLADLSSWNTGLRDQLEVVVLADSAALQWALRDFPNARYEASLSPAESPPAVITQKGADEPRLAQQYRGQDFVWHLYPGWQGSLPSDFVNWLAFRQAPLAQDQIILWARTDIFPGGASTATGNATP